MVDRDAMDYCEDLVFLDPSFIVDLGRGTPSIRLAYDLSAHNSRNVIAMDYIGRCLFVILGNSFVHVQGDCNNRISGVPRRCICSACVPFVCNLNKSIEMAMFELAPGFPH